MAYNCKVELNGVLGNDPKVIDKDGKTFVALRVATTDSYPIQDGDETTWKDKESLWHEVLVFRPYIVSIVKDLKKKDIVEISGTLSYRSFKDVNGHTKHEASVIANFIKKIEVGESDESTKEQVFELVEEIAKS